MTWREFKEAVEAQGVTDDAAIVFIDVVDDDIEVVSTPGGGIAVVNG